MVRGRSSMGLQGGPEPAPGQTRRGNRTSVVPDAGVWLWPDQQSPGAGWSVHLHLAISAIMKKAKTELHVHLSLKINKYIEVYSENTLIINFNFMPN